MILIDLTILTYHLLFNAIRKETVLAFMAVIIQSLNVTRNATIDLYDESIYELNFDCLKINFEHYLNDQHDAVLRRIFIRDIENTDAVYLYQPSENNEVVYIGQAAEGIDLILFQPLEIASLLDFEVVLPIGLTYVEPVLTNNIEKFRLPGMTYQIVEE